jgi:ribosomal protein L35AE/L33A
LFSLKPAFVYVLESEVVMKLPYGYVLVGEEIVIHEERADVVRSIFEYYLAGASLGKIVDKLFAKGISSPTGNPIAIQ